MNIHRNMAKVLVLVSTVGKIKTRELAEKLSLSYARTLQILKDLDRMGLIRLGRGFAEAIPFLRDLILRVNEKYPLEEILVGSIPIILSKVFEPRTIKEISALTGFTEKYIRKVLNKLSIRGIVEKIEDKYVLPNDPVLRVFLFQITRILEGIEPEARVVYRDNYYIIKELPKGYKGSGTPTAFSVFYEYGIPIETNREIYIYPPKSLEIEEIIIHSLLVAKTKQEFTLVALLYAKYYYELDHQKLFFYARWFKQTEKLFQLESYLHGTEEPPFLPWNELEDLAKLYNVDLSAFTRKHFNEKILQEIGTKLESEVKAILFGGAEMVIKGYKISTKDIDIAFLNEKAMQKFIKALAELGYKPKSKNDIMIYEHKNLSRVDIYLGKIGKLVITQGIIKRTQKLEYNKLKVLMLSDTDLLLTKLISARPRDIEDAKIIIRKGNVDWKTLIDELLIQEKITKHHYCLLVLSILEEIEQQMKIHIPHKKRLLHITTEHMVEYAYKEYGLKDPKDIKKLINISEDTIRRILKKIKHKNNHNKEKTQ